MSGAAPHPTANGGTQREAQEGDSRIAASGSRFVMPAEWFPHASTWIAWPHHEPDWPGKLEPVAWVYAEIVRALHLHERVEVLCHDERVRDDALARLGAHGCDPARYRLHLVPNDRVWLRDSAPTMVHDESGQVALVNWRFNAWAKYDNYSLDSRVGAHLEAITGYRRIEPLRPDGASRVVLEGGAIESNGAGLLMVTEECLLSSVQARNPGLSREEYEQVFREALGIRETVWLGEGCVGDDTHGHIDDIARFVSEDTVVLAFEEDPADDNHGRSVDNWDRLRAFGGGRLRVVRLPYPRPVIMDGQRLPASYANFYVANDVVLVPTFNDSNDRVALNVLAECFPSRDVIGIHSVDLVWGLGTLHCLSQQQPTPLPERE